MRQIMARERFEHMYVLYFIEAYFDVDDRANQPKGERGSGIFRTRLVCKSEIVIEKKKS